jgi:class 3 adenylate cyclase
MDCPNCGRANRQGANFCRYCGAHFALACPRCRTVLADDAAFCDNCGYQLPAAAARADEQPQAGRVPAIPPPQLSAVPARTSATTGRAALVPSALDSFIPGELLRKLETARASGEMVGERRVVTMLFCDIKGSTAAAERLDPEDYTEIINGAFEHMIKPVYTYEGTLARLMGDAILAFFGAPIAHEDDPQRAVLAGLLIVKSIATYRQQVHDHWSLDFDVRVGINTGLVVVGAVGSDLRLEYSALGDAINLAARMEQSADPGTVRIAEDTYRAVRNQFEVEALGAVEVKGKAEPVPAYRVLRRKAQPARARGIEGLHAELVGRQAEIQALRGVMADLKQGVGRIVTVLGEAGLGKSRLVAEAHQLFSSAIGQQGSWYDIGSLSYETNQAYSVARRLLERIHGVDFNDEPAALREKVAEMVAALPAEQRERAAHVFEAVLRGSTEGNGLALDGEAFRPELAAAMDAWWRKHFGQRPTVIAFDDMHWSDSASLALLEELLPLTGQIPLVLIWSLRAERESPVWRLKSVADQEYQHRYTELLLHSLSEAESNELINRLLAVAELPDQLRASVLEKSGGNPFFIEEVVRTLIERGIVVAEERLVAGKPQRVWRASSASVDFAIPDNLQALLAARLDRLEDGTRGTLQLASVIGRSFYHRVLQAVADSSRELDQHLSMLLRLDMIREAARLPEVEYVFRNPLTQEAVYQTILLKRRRDFHRRVGAAMEALYPDRLEALCGLLAHHFRLAGERAKAIDYSRRTAQQAVNLFAYEDARHNLTAALNLTQPGEASAIRLALLEELGDVDRLLRDGLGAITQYQAALEVCARLADPDPMAVVRLHRKIVQVVADIKWTVVVDDWQRAKAAGELSRVNLQERLSGLMSAPPNAETVRALTALSTDAWRIQEPPDWETAQELAQSAVDMAQQLGGWVDLSQALGALATVLDGRSRLREHLEVAQQRLSICHGPQRDDLRERLESLRSIGAALMYVGEYQAALPYLREAEDLAMQAQAVDQQVNALSLQAQCWFRLDRWDEVLAAEDKWRALERNYSRNRVGETCFTAALSSSVHALRGNWKLAEAYATEAYDYMVAMSGTPDQWQRNQFY